VPSSTAPLSLWRVCSGTGLGGGLDQLWPFADLEKFRYENHLAINNTNFLLELATLNGLESASRTIRRKIHGAVTKGAILVDNREILARTIEAPIP
jgi:hypothetical protein